MMKTVSKSSLFLIIISLCVSTQALPKLGKEENKKRESSFYLDNSSIDRTSQLMPVSFANMLDQAKPAVVTVATKRIVRVMHMHDNPVEEFLRRFYGFPGNRSQNLNRADIEEQRIPNGLGSGVLVSEDGYILTNNHVVSLANGEAADAICVTLADGSEQDAILIGRDEKTDVAVLKIEQKGLPFIPMANSDNSRVGDFVFAIGNPLGLEQTVTMGIISAKGRSDLQLLGQGAYENFIQTDASINMGNSGGALIDTKGRLIGINTAIVSESGGNIGIGFAIPLNLARQVMLSLIDDGAVKRGFLGVGINDLSPELAEAFGVEQRKAALVESVDSTSPAGIAGVKRGDIIIELDSEEVLGATDLRLRISQKQPGSEVELTVLRDQKRKKIRVVLGDLNDPYGMGQLSSPLEGITLYSVDEYPVRGNISVPKGLVVAKVDLNSPYFNILSENMVILEVNDHEVSKLDELSHYLRRGVNKLWVSYGRNQGYLALRIK